MSDCEECEKLTLEDLIENLEIVVNRAQLMSPPFVDPEFENIRHLIEAIKEKVEKK